MERVTDKHRRLSSASDGSSGGSAKAQLSRKRQLPPSFDLGDELLDEDGDMLLGLPRSVAPKTLPANPASSKRARKYVPRYRSGPYALLLALATVSL